MDYHAPLFRHVAVGGATRRLLKILGVIGAAVGLRDEKRDEEVMIR